MSKGVKNINTQDLCVFIKFLVGIIILKINIKLILFKALQVKSLL